ncbi:MAG: right-handed parallel beta-helix repeat-containing protein [Bacillota bacterium]
MHMLYRKLILPAAVFVMIFSSLTGYCAETAQQNPTSTGNAYFVAPAPQGSDDNPGTIDKPWASIQKAAAAAQAGDTVYLRDGTYKITEPIRPANSGTKDKWITYSAYEKEKAVIDAMKRRVGNGKGEHPTAPNLTDEGAFQINDLSYIRVQGITVQNSHNGGINIRKSSYIELIGNTTRNTNGSGIGVWYSDHIKVLNNHVFKANAAFMDDTGGGQGGPHEAVSLGSVDYFEVAYNEVNQCEHEGIDIKQASRWGTVHHNKTHDLVRQGIYVDGWPYNPANLECLAADGHPDLLTDVEIYENIVYNCSMGVVVSSEAGTPVKNISIHHNVVYNNRNAGVHIAYYFGEDGPRENISVVNNTIHHNGWEKEFWWSSGGIFFETHNIKNIIIRNNICTDNGCFQIGATGQDLAKIKASIDYNLCSGDMQKIDIKEIHRRDRRPKYSILPFPGSHALSADPMYVDAAKGDFRLKAGSRAINAGHPDKKYRDPDGSRNDLGALPYEKGK